MTEAILLESAQAAVDHLEMTGIEWYTLEAKRSPNPGKDALQEDEDGLADIEVRTAFRKADNGVDYRCRIDLTFGRAQASVVVDGGVLFRSEHPVELTDPAVADFGSNVAMMALYPYLRQMVSDIGGRIGLEAVLPMIRRGDIQFEID